MRLKRFVTEATLAVDCVVAVTTVAAPPGDLVHAMTKRRGATSEEHVKRDFEKLMFEAYPRVLLAQAINSDEFCHSRPVFIGRKRYTKDA